MLYRCILLFVFSIGTFCHSALGKEATDSIHAHINRFNNHISSIIAAFNQPGSMSRKQLYEKVRIMDHASTSLQNTIAQQYPMLINSIWDILAHSVNTATIDNNKLIDEILLEEGLHPNDANRCHFFFSFFTNISTFLTTHPQPTPGDYEHLAYLIRHSFRQTADMLNRQANKSISPKKQQWTQSKKLLLLLSTATIIGVCFIGSLWLYSTIHDMAKREQTENHTYNYDHINPIGLNKSIQTPNKEIIYTSIMSEKTTTNLSSQDYTQNIKQSKQQLHDLHSLTQEIKKIMDSQHQNKTLNAPDGVLRKINNVVSNDTIKNLGNIASTINHVGSIINTISGSNSKK